MTKILSSKTLQKYKKDILNILIAAVITVVSVFSSLTIVIVGLINNQHSFPLIAISLLIISIIALIYIITTMIKIVKTFITTSTQVYDYFTNMTNTAFSESRKDVTDE